MQMYTLTPISILNQPVLIFFLACQPYKDHIWLKNVADLKLIWADLI